MVNRRGRSEFKTEAAWGHAVRLWLGTDCMFCGRNAMSGNTQADHLIPRSQGGLNDLANGWIICSFQGCKLHERLTNYQTDAKIDPNILTRDHLAYLEAKGYVIFDQDGQPTGLGMSRFLPLRKE